ncbi:E3 ubiquitin-protein ligase RNF13 [Paramyrothecium foliicola]|nr:E3 ubiquitin-protein ligase RNF13 [Paramyrothecium foliicola]
MRAPRLAILVLFIFVSLFVLVRSVTSSARTNAFPYPAKPRASKSVMGFMYNTPFSLFPPNAAISLTDDNSTTFTARPAGFGPKLAAKGLSGELWVGNGFPEDPRDGNGELGCGDLVGWDGRNGQTSQRDAPGAASRSYATTKDGSTKRSGGSPLGVDGRAVGTKDRSRLADVLVDDGTDDYLHAGLTNSVRDPRGSSTHADIQSIQETAEIKGKVVLLMRGGCGFLKKVLWAQRRGAIAVIVGDNQKGGPLIHMFAHGDEVENVTIPSVFTAWTTARILSSLTETGSFIENAIDENGNPIFKVQRGAKSAQKGTESQKDGQPMASKLSASPSSQRGSRRAAKSTGSVGERSAPSTSTYKHGWLSRLFNVHEIPRRKDTVNRSSTNGRLDWVSEEDWTSEKNKIIKDSIKSPTDMTGSTRDGLVRESPGEPRFASKESRTSQKKSTSNEKVAADGSSARSGQGTGSTRYYSSAKSGGKARNVVSRLVGDDEEDLLLVDTIVESDDSGIDEGKPDGPPAKPHNGLWVTITPTTSGNSFLDTLLVLVISPLVTLTVVYALLLLRARIRRRRWRAPKSVVERLPVRTYQAVTPSPSRSPTRSPRLPSPTSSSPTTPLLQQGPNRSRPRSRTTNATLETESLPTPTAAVQTPQTNARSSPREHEKGSGGFSAEWRKYMGRQVECVVCLEEYVDGTASHHGLQRVDGLVQSVKAMLSNQWHMAPRQVPVMNRTMMIAMMSQMLKLRAPAQRITILTLNMAYSPRNLEKTVAPTYKKVGSGSFLAVSALVRGLRHSVARNEIVKSPTKAVEDHDMILSILKSFAAITLLA